jgi:anthranilate phosphoribosyltransferase
MDEISIAAPTYATKLQNNTIVPDEITPELANLPRSPVSALKGGNAEENAQAIRELLAGTPSAFRDIVLLNAGAALIVAGKARDLQSGARLAAEAIDSGAARDLLARAAALSRRSRP